MLLIQELIDDQYGWVCHNVVDPIALGLPDYLDVVITPMHIELVKKKTLVENAIYSDDMEAFERDLKLVCESAILFTTVKRAKWTVWHKPCSTSFTSRTQR